MGQEDQLAGLAFTWKLYQAYSGNWEHDHCGFCFKKFLDPAYADWMREALANPSEENAGAGYTNVRAGDTPPRARIGFAASASTTFGLSSSGESLTQNPTHGRMTRPSRLPARQPQISILTARPATTDALALSLCVRFADPPGG
jgi:hypothetical protein